jgi:electron transfer flavoprotein beta subunit
MNLFVLMKQTFDTEEKIVVQGGAVAEDGVKFVVNPYDEYAVEEAIRQKERHGGTVTVVSVGPERAAEALRTALAMGADEAVLIADDRIADEYGISRALAAYLGAQACDVVLGGNFSVDSGAGQVAVRVAHLLGLPHVASVTKLEIQGGRAVAERDAEGDTETLEVALPALFTAQQGLNEPRYPSLPGIMKAKKKPFRQLGLDDLGLTEDDVAARTARDSLSLPPERKAGRLLAGDPAGQAAELVRLLRDESKAL